MLLIVEAGILSQILMVEQQERLTTGSSLQPTFSSFKMGLKFTNCLSKPCRA